MVHEFTVCVVEGAMSGSCVGSPKRTIGMIVGLGHGNSPRQARTASLVVVCVLTRAVLAVLSLDGVGEGRMLSHKGGVGMGCCPVGT